MPERIVIAYFLIAFLICALVALVVVLIRRRREQRAIMRGGRSRPTKPRRPLE